MAARPLKRVAMLLSCDSFERFFGGMFGLTRARYVAAYRNDFAWDYAQGLARLGHDVTIYILSYGPASREPAEPGVAVRFLPLPPWHRWADALIFRGGRRLPATLRDAAAWRAFGPALRRALSEDRIELLYVQEFWPHRFDLLVRDLTLPIIGADHGAQHDPRLRAAKARSLPKAFRLTCQDDIQLERARALGGHAVMLRNGVDTTFFTPTLPPRDRPRTVLAVGRLVEAQKRFADLLRAMVFLPDFSLTLAGSGPDLVPLQALARELGIADCVTFPGFVGDRQALRALYRGCGVFVSTSAWEAVALVMLEAMSSGAPVVGTDIPAFNTLITDRLNGRLVAVGAAEALAGAIGDAYAQRETLSANARRTALDRYGSEQTYRALSALIEAA